MALQVSTDEQYNEDDMWQNRKCLICQSSHETSEDWTIHKSLSSHKQKVKVHHFLESSYRFESTEQISASATLLDSPKFPYLGKECIHEFHDESVGFTFWICSLCYCADEKSLTTVGHLLSNAHRMLYLSSFHPELIPKTTSKAQLTFDLNNVAQQLKKEQSECLPEVLILRTEVDEAKQLLGIGQKTEQSDQSKVKFQDLATVEDMDIDNDESIVKSDSSFTGICNFSAPGTSLRANDTSDNPSNGKKGKRRRARKNKKNELAIPQQSCFPNPNHVPFTPRVSLPNQRSTLIHGPPLIFPIPSSRPTLMSGPPFQPTLLPDYIHSMVRPAHQLNWKQMPANLPTPATEINPTRKAGAKVAQIYDSEIEDMKYLNTSEDKSQIAIWCEICWKVISFPTDGPDFKEFWSDHEGTQIHQEKKMSRPSVTFETDDFVPVHAEPLLTFDLRPPVDDIPVQGWVWNEPSHCWQYTTSFVGLEFLIERYGNPINCMSNARDIVCQLCAQTLAIDKTIVQEHVMSEEHIIQFVHKKDYFFALRLLDMDLDLVKRALIDEWIRKQQFANTQIKVYNKNLIRLHQSLLGRVGYGGKDEGTIRFKKSIKDTPLLYKKRNDVLLKMLTLECYAVADTNDILIQKQLYQCKEPLIGLQYVVEVYHGTQFRSYWCRLCCAIVPENENGFTPGIIHHLLHPHHQLCYLKKHYIPYADEVEKLGKKCKRDRVIFSATGLTGKKTGEFAAIVEHAEGRKFVDKRLDVDINSSKQLVRCFPNLAERQVYTLCWKYDDNRKLVLTAQKYGISQTNPLKDPHPIIIKQSLDIASSVLPSSTVVSSCSLSVNGQYQTPSASTISGQLATSLSTNNSADLSVRRQDEELTERNKVVDKEKLITVGEKDGCTETSEKGVNRENRTGKSIIIEKQKEIEQYSSEEIEEEKKNLKKNVINSIMKSSTKTIPANEFPVGIQKELDDCQEPLIGIDDAIEVCDTNHPKSDWCSYLCYLCGVWLSQKQVIDHFTSVNHRTEYVTTNGIRIWDEQSDCFANASTLIQNPQLLTNTAFEIEKKNGRHPISNRCDYHVPVEILNKIWPGYKLANEKNDEQQLKKNTISSLMQSTNHNIFSTELPVNAQKQIDQCEQPLIGIDQVFQVCNTDYPDSDWRSYLCYLCGVWLSEEELVEHLASDNHVIVYVTTNGLRIWDDTSETFSNATTLIQNPRLLAAAATQIEKKYGRLAITERSDYRVPVETLIKIWPGFNTSDHAQQTSDPTSIMKKTRPTRSRRRLLRSLAKQAKLTSQSHADDISPQRFTDSQQKNNDSPHHSRMNSSSPRKDLITSPKRSEDNLANKLTNDVEAECGELANEGNMANLQRAKQTFPVESPSFRPIPTIPRDNPGTDQILRQLDALLQNQSTSKTGVSFGIKSSRRQFEELGQNIGKTLTLEENVTQIQSISSELEPNVDTDCALTTVDNTEQILRACLGVNEQVSTEQLVQILREERERQKKQDDQYEMMSNLLRQTLMGDQDSTQTSSTSIPQNIQCSSDIPSSSSQKRSSLDEAIESSSKKPHLDISATQKIGALQWKIRKKLSKK